MSQGLGYLEAFFSPFPFDNICEVRLNIWGNIYNPSTTEAKSQPTLQRESHSKKPNLSRFLENCNTYQCLSTKCQRNSIHSSIKNFLCLSFPIPPILNVYSHTPAYLNPFLEESRGHWWVLGFPSPRPIHPSLFFHPYHEWISAHLICKAPILASLFRLSWPLVGILHH